MDLHVKQYQAWRLTLRQSINLAKVETENDCLNCEKIFENKNNLKYKKMCLGKTGTKKRQKKRPENKETKILSQKTDSSSGDF